MLKKTFFQIHWFLGITAGLILSLMGVTGAIYSYEQQILKLINQDSYVIQVQNTPKLTPAEIYQHFNKENAEIKINSITVAKDPTASSTVNIEKEGARRGQNILINPYNAQQLPEIKGQQFFQFIQQLHRNLTVGPVGKQITGACTLILILFVLSGLYLRWPKKHSLKQWLAVKPKLKGRNFLWDLHAVVGTWVVIFYLLLACTGLYWSYDWWRNGMFKVLGVERPQPEMQANQPRPEGRGNNPQNQGEHKEGNGEARSEANRSNREQNTEAQSRRDDSQVNLQTRSGHNDESKKNNRDRKGLNPEQINIALTQAWTGFNSQIGRDYSTLTLNIPKKPNGEMEISFVDAVPQHERARNKATFNYKTSEIKDIEIYEDKKLNEKIMSSMLPVHRGSFFGPVYQFFAMVAALLMPLFFVTGWMLYLKRRKQKKLTLAARNSQTGFIVDPNAKPWLIVYASQTGVSEQLAWSTATSLQEAHQPVTVKSAQQISLQDLQNTDQVLFIASTYGTGEAPDLASGFAKKVLNVSADLNHLNYAVLALGSKEYAETYCSFGHAIDAWLKNNKAHAFFDVIEVDNANKEHIQKWNASLAKATNLDLHHVSIDKTFDQWTLKNRILLNENSLGAPAYSIELVPSHDATWQAGDIAEIQPGNSPGRIHQFMLKHQIIENTKVDSSGIRIKQALLYKDLTSEIEPFANLDHLLEQLVDLPAREYSIASIPSQQVLRLVVRQQSNTLGQLGLGSGWLTQYANLNTTLDLRIRTNESFHLIDDNRPIICIGNGTGIAGLMSILHTRVRQDYSQNWLIFGERQIQHDYFFQETIEAWKNMGMLQRLDLAFSRDQAEKIYVHHKLAENADELKKWIDEGAVIYVCGSINGMATDIDSTLVHILGETTVDQLRQDGRYRRDVY